MLTPKQKKIFEYIKKYVKEKDYSPSLGEIGKHFRLAKSTIHQHVESLRIKGYLKKIENQPRSIELKQKKKISDLVEIPLLGTIAAGEPIEVFENPETIKVQKNLLSKSGEHFALKVQGESMIDEGIFDDSTVIIRKQPMVENGETAVALINGNEVTLKKIYKEKNGFRLQPANPGLKPIFTKELIIQGKVINVIRNFEEFKNKISIKEAEKFSENNEIYSRNTLKEWLNTVQCMDCVEGMKQLPDNSIDLVVTSPPYDGIRKYNGFSYDLHATGKELYRILKDGGIVAMVIQDQTKNFAKTLTSFRTIVDWCDNIGFRLFETVIYRKYGAEGAWWNKRFRVDHEYMPIFLKGGKPKYFNKEPLKIPSKWGGKTLTGGATRLTNGKTLKARAIKINLLKCRGTVWDYLMAGDKNPLKSEHPATFPNQIPIDFIQCFCPPKGVVLDPFMGSGTTAVAAVKLDRKFIGFDISEEYCKLANKRLEVETNFRQKKLF